MKFYLSSYKLGNKTNDLVRLMSHNKKIAYIPNACDFSNADIERRKKGIEMDMESLSEIGFVPELLDLKEYFYRTNDLREKIKEFGGVFVRGGNTFILRQAMKLSGFDIIFNELITDENFVYSGYSAGACVLAPDLKALQNVDNPYDFPYLEYKETIWEGLGYLDYIILPHYKSNHPESEDIDKEVEFCKKNNIPFKTLSDGEVIIIE